MSFHLYRINELYSNAAGSVQFVEMAIEQPRSTISRSAPRKAARRTRGSTPTTTATAGPTSRSSVSTTRRCSCT